VDRRADIWALGVVFFEMLTGRQIYSGETVTDTIAQVITQPPDWAQLPADTATAIRRVLRRCLEKDPRSRFQAAGDVRIEIDEYPRHPKARRRHRRPRLVAPAWHRRCPGRSPPCSGLRC
jgi:serine/threonine-protein kinase